MERADRLTSPPIVGRFYLVPTVRFPLYGVTSEWPVRGRVHNDLEHLAFAQDHYHLDHRFFDAREAASVFGLGWRAPELNAAAVVLSEGVHGLLGKLPDTPSLKRRRCSRVELAYPRMHAARGEKFPLLWNAFAGQQCARGKAGWICPHRQVPLGSFAPHDGVLTCPLHGLRIDTETGVVLPALEAAA